MTIRKTFKLLPLLLLVACSQGPPKTPSLTDASPAVVNAAPTPSTDHSMDSKDSRDTSQEQQVVSNKYNDLSASEARVILNKGTDRPGNSGYTKTDDAGTYLCRQCNAQLYRAEDKFESDCGWPSFDDEIDGAVTNVPDADGRRVEIICTNCEGHLGHVFTGERMTSKNVRHCVNTSSMSFIAQGDPLPAKIVLSE
ncbi:MAG: peptide-methionine (R)-S-oxide reductase [Planctomycetota bacterium]|jgi:peptide-methionine (R)-S-oxide reductase